MVFLELGKHLGPLRVTIVDVVHSHGHEDLELVCSGEVDHDLNRIETLFVKGSRHVSREDACVRIKRLSDLAREGHVAQTGRPRAIEDGPDVRSHEVGRSLSEQGFGRGFLDRVNDGASVVIEDDATFSVSGLAALLSVVIEIHVWASW